MSHQSTQNKSLLLRYHQWSKTRYPLKNWVFSILVYIAIVLYVRALSGGLYLEGLDILNSFAVGCFFLLLRIYDEHKDYEIDLKFHPERPVASGVVRLKELRYLFVAALLLQISTNYLSDHFAGGVTFFWLLAFVWSILMAKEFFIGEWLQKRLLIYALTHMLIMIPLGLWIVYMGQLKTNLQSPISWVIALLVFLTGAIMEVARKTHSPVNEIKGVDSYSSLLEPKGSVGLLAILDLLYWCSLSFLLFQLPALTSMNRYVAIAFVGLVVLFCFWQSRIFLVRLGSGDGEKVEDSHGILILSIIVTLIVCAYLGSV